jgi:hypothetical protein
LLEKGSAWQIHSLFPSDISHLSFFLLLDSIDLKMGRPAHLHLCFSYRLNLLQENNQVKSVEQKATCTVLLSQHFFTLCGTGVLLGIIDLLVQLLLLLERPSLKLK